MRWLLKNWGESTSNQRPHLYSSQSLNEAYVFLGGGFKHFLFASLFEEMIQFDQYVSDGLKPPTRFLILCFLCNLFQAKKRGGTEYMKYTSHPAKPNPTYETWRFMKFQLAMGQGCETLSCWSPTQQWKSSFTTMSFVSMLRLFWGGIWHAPWQKLAFFL